MNARKLAIDPLWQCLCPSWTATPLRYPNRVLAPRKRPALQCANLPTPVRTISRANKIRIIQAHGGHVGETQQVLNPLYNGPLPPPQPRNPLRPSKPISGTGRPKGLPPVNAPINFREEETVALYNYMRGAAIDGKYNLCRTLVEMLVKERGEKPNMQLYNTLILSNISPGQGAAWRVIDLLAEMEQDGLQPDVGTCHAVLKVSSVHVDHLLRADILDYMSQRWFQLTEDGAHDVAAGLFREGLFEQALQRLDLMRQEGMHVRPWLLDMAGYILCEANEIGEALRLMRWRVETNEPNLSRALWMFFLDKASGMRHHAATSLAWSSQVNNEFINPSNGICINVLSTAAQAADAEMATEVFDKLSKRGAKYEPIHYELLINTYLAATPPDIKRALTILTVMPLEKLQPSAIETRALFQHLQDSPELVLEAQDTLRQLHEEGRKIPIAALNLLVECYVYQKNLKAALNLYKQIHTFVPLAEGAKKTFANIETFNLLLRGCHQAAPPEDHQASFLVSELLALRITPTALTFDRLIISFVNAAAYLRSEAASIEDTIERDKREAKATELIEWSVRHLEDMQDLNWLPRYGTLRVLSVALAGRGDVRCWDVLQAGEDHAARVDGWPEKGKLVRREVEEVFHRHAGKDVGEDLALSMAAETAGGADGNTARLDSLGMSGRENAVMASQHM